MTLKQYLNSLPKTKSRILININDEQLFPFGFVTQEQEDYEAEDKHRHFPCKKDDLCVSDGCDFSHIFDVNQEIKFAKNSIFVISRSGFKEKLTFYIQNLIPVGNLQ